jgi:hypothetical protein
MYKKTMKTVDFGGTERVEDYYFNLTESEIMEMELGTEGGFVEMVRRITDAKSQLELANLFKTMICKSYGVLSPDGRKFIKNDTVLNDFLATQAFSDLYMELVSDEGKAAEFFNEVLPEKIKAQQKKEAAAVPTQPGVVLLADAQY